MPIRDAFKKKIEKFGDFVLNSLTPYPPPLIGTKKNFRTICSAFGPPPSFIKLGQNGEKNLVHKSILKINFKPFKKLEMVGGASNIKNREHVIFLIEPLTIFSINLFVCCSL